MTSSARTPRVLSVQSHVVSGYCGNKCATFPLQLLEFEVDVINSTQLSNHTQYATTRGKMFDNSDLLELHAGLRENDLLELYDMVITGYIADETYIATSLLELVQEIKSTRKRKNLNFMYTLDPVLGDDGVGYYVPNGTQVAGAYKKFLLDQADIVTPNKFEATILTGIDINSQTEADLMLGIKKSTDVFHKQYGISFVAISSIELATDPNSLICVASMDPSVFQSESSGLKSPIAELKIEDSQSHIWTIKVPKLPLPFTGTGDLFTALFSGWLHKTSYDVKLSLENTVNTIQTILEDTLKWCNQLKSSSVQAYELRLVQNRDAILKPQAKYSAKMDSI